MNSTPPDSTELARHHRWFSEEVYRHGPSLRSYLVGKFPSVRDVDDIVQESYVRTWRAREGGSIQSAKAFLFKVANHLTVDVLRRERRSPIAMQHDLTTMEVEAESTPVAEMLSHREKVELLAEAIDRLPARCREVVVMRKLHQLSQRETATRLGISEKGVENQLARGLTRCRSFFEKRGVHTIWS